MGAEATMDRVQMEHLAKLASLSLTRDEEETLTHEVVAILRYVDELNQLDTSNVDVDRERVAPDPLASSWWHMLACALHVQILYGIRASSFVK